MRTFGSLFAAFFALFVFCGAAPKAPVPPRSNYNPFETFAPLALPDPVNRYRSAGGVPGPDYWQNRADYKIHATLDTAANVLTADETITYTNNSPDALDCLWLQLDQNIYRKDSRARAAGGRNVPMATEGFVLDKIEIGNTAADYIVTDTRAQIRLPQPLGARGGKLEIRIRYHYEIPGPFGGRTAHDKSAERRNLRHRPMVSAHGGI